jgi:hypothetical protein
MALRYWQHLRDEAGSLLAALELGGADELVVASGGTAIAALICSRSHMFSERSPPHVLACPLTIVDLIRLEATRRCRPRWQNYARGLRLG